MVVIQLIIGGTLMLTEANTLPQTKKYWYHIAVTFICMSIFFLSCCLVAAADSEDTVISEAINNQTVDMNEQHINELDYQEGAFDGEEVDKSNRTPKIRSVENKVNNRAVEDAPNVTGSWKAEAGGWRFYTSSGFVQKGFCYIDGKKYYFGLEDGVMQFGWQKIDGAYYYFGGISDGSMKANWQHVNGRWYYLGDSNDGMMKSGWQRINDSYYYFGGVNDGSMKTNWQHVGGCWYYLGSANDGVMKSGWQHVNGAYYYLGRTNDGSMKTAWQLINGLWYYLGSTNDGAMRSGWQKIYNSYFYFGNTNDGAMKSGWQNINGHWYFMDNNGYMKTGMQNIAGKQYYLGSVNDGAMKTGWQAIEGVWYYFNDSGVAVNGWQAIAGYWYYLEKNYIMVSNVIKVISGQRYAFSSSGAMLTNAFAFKGRYYFTDSSGAITNETEISDVISFGMRFIGENGYRFNDWYYDGNTKYRSWAWCNTFVSYVMYNCGINFKKTAYVPNAEQWMHANYKWVGYNEAKVGDVIVFCWNGAGHNSGSGDRDHIGFLISKNADGTFTTLEGNTKGVVAVRTRYSKNIRNIFSPR